MSSLTVEVPAAGPRSYRVVVEPGGLDELGRACRRALPDPHRIAVISDETVAGLYGERALEALAGEGLDGELFAFPPGEGSKTRATWGRLTDRMLEAGCGRDTAVVALGGGVTGDLAGFVAATFMRGVPVVQVPTTLLAMVDAAVGGKTAVDTPRGKNLVGAFHHPSLVVADPGLLDTLPARQLRAGLAEAVKTAAVADADLLDWIEDRTAGLSGAEPGPTARLVRRCVELKAEVVADDPEEAGRRQVLNFGHTVAHALEAASGWDLLHGHAVAAGMRVEARLGEEMGVTRSGTARRLAAALEALGHRDRPEERLEAGSLLGLAAADKKAREGRVRFVLLERPGRVARGRDGAWSRPLPAERAADLLQDALRPGDDPADSAPD